MKTNQLSYRYKYFSSLHPNLGTYIVLSMSVRGMKYKRHVVYAAFNKYVLKNDFAKEERDTLLEDLERITKMLNPYTLVKSDGSTEPNQKGTLRQAKSKSSAKASLPKP